MIITVVLAVVLALIFRNEIAERIRGLDRVVIGKTTFYLREPQSRSDLELVLSNIAGKSSGIQAKYLRAMLSERAEELEQMQGGEVIVSTPAKIFDELLRLIRSSNSELYSINHRPEVWAGSESPLAITYAEYLAANKEAINIRGVKIHRLEIFSRGRANDHKIKEILDKHLASGIDVRYAFTEEINKTEPYSKLYAEFNRRGFGLNFDQVNIVKYDGEVIVHTLSVGPAPFRYATKLRITWRKEDLEQLDPSALFQLPIVHQYQGRVVQ
jgi:hypothetical protein